MFDLWQAIILLKLFKAPYVPIGTIYSSFFDCLKCEMYYLAPFKTDKI